MKIAFITDSDPVNRMVIGKIAERFPPAVMYVVDWSSAKPKRSIFTKLANAGRLPGLWTRNWAQGKRGKWLAERIQEPTNDKGYQQIVSPKEVNSKRVAAELLEHEVDLLIVCGSPILRKRIFESPKIATINIHFGLSTAYRGQHTIFWPLLERQYDKVGGTVHLIDEGVDTGQMLIEYCPNVEPSDHEFSLDLKIGNGIAKPMLVMLEELEESGSGSLTGQPPARLGKEIISRDRGFWISMKYELQGMLGQRKLPELPERINEIYQIAPAQPHA